MLKTIDFKTIIEAVLFTAKEPISESKLLTLFDKQQRPKKSLLVKELKELQHKYEQSVLQLQQSASGWQFQLREEFSPWIKKLAQKSKPRYSRTLFETLALIIYKQPITRGEIEAIRGVAVSSQIIKTLQDHGWIIEIGKKEAPGRPILYGSSKKLLDHFGLKNLAELPSLNND